MSSMSRFQPLQPRSLRHSEQGIVSMMVTMILIIVLSLTVLAFAQLSRRNARQALDNQLSTQAFYAAESGVNDARNLIATANTNGTAVQPKTTCNDTGNGFYSSLNNTLNSAANIAYTCLLVNPSPNSLVYSSVNTHSLIVPVNSANGANLKTINLAWQSKLVSGSPLAGCPGSTNGVFSPTASWSCGYGVLRFDLVPTSSNNLTVDSLSGGTMTVFAVPVTGGGTNAISYAPGGTNAVSGVTCTNSGCNLSVDVSSAASANYYMRISSVYKDASLQLTGNDAAGQVNLSGAQVLIDSTGKAQDVLRRLQARAPVAATSRNQLPDYAMQSTSSVCKRFSIMQGFFQNSPSGVSDASNPLCQ